MIMSIHSLLSPFHPSQLHYKFHFPHLCLLFCDLLSLTWVICMIISVKYLSEPGGLTRVHINKDSDFLSFYHP